MTSGRNRVLLVCAGAAVSMGALVLSGCNGPGKYTGDFKKQAQLRVSQMKAATEWDMARQQFFSGDLQKALQSIDRSLTMDPTVSKSHLLRGRILLEQSRVEEALAAFDAAIAMKPENAEAFYYRGIVFERVNQPERAFESYMSAAERDTTDPQYILAAAETLIDQNLLDQAETLLTAQKSFFELNAGIRQTLGHIAALRSDYERAVTLFREACVLGAGDPALREDLARAEMMAGRFVDAEGNLRWLMTQKGYPSRRDLKQLQARCLVELERPVEARTLLLSLVEGDGASDISSWVELGNVAAMLNDQARLREAGQRLMSIAPARGEGYIFSALWQRQRGDLEQAARTLARGMAADKTNADIAVLRGIILEDLGRPVEAAQSYEIALKRNPGDAHAGTLLAAVRSGSLQYAEVGTED